MLQKRKFSRNDEKNVAIEINKLICFLLIQAKLKNSWNFRNNFSFENTTSLI